VEELQAGADRGTYQAGELVASLKPRCFTRVTSAGGCAGFRRGWVRVRVPGVPGCRAEWAGSDVLDGGGGAGGQLNAVRIRPQPVAIALAQAQVASMRSRVCRAARVIRAATCRTW
jgi:hypothetical protein